MQKHLKLVASWLLITFLASLRCEAQTDHNQLDLFVVKSKDGLQFPISSNGITASYITNFSTKSQLHSYFGLFDIPMDHYPDTVKKLIKEEYPEADLSRKPFRDTLAFVNQYYETIEDYLVKYDSSYLVKDTTKFYLTDVGTGALPVFFNVSVTNISKSLNQFFTSTNQPTVGLEVGMIQNAVTNFNNWDKLIGDGRTQFGAYDYDFFYSVYANTSLINYYDTLHHQITKTSWSTLSKFSQVGVKLELNLYYFRWLAVSLTSNTYRGLSLASDSSYQSQIPNLVSDTPLVVKSGVVSGKYGGDINNKPISQRFGIATPIFLYFLDFLKKPHDDSVNNRAISKFYLMPSFATYGPYNGKWTNQLGISINFLSQGYGGKNSTIVQGGGFGCDFITAKTHTGWGNALFYISGSINLGGLFQTGAPKSKNKGPLL